MTQQSFSSLEQAHKKKRTKREIFLGEMEAAVPWARLEALIAPHYTKQRLGRPQMPLAVMLRIYFLQQWYYLSDPGAEEALYDMHSMREFAGLDLAHDAVPDETTILNFRHLLERHNLTEVLFEAVSSYLQEQSLLMRGGTIMDATLIAASPSTKNKTNKRDPDMSQTKKGNQWYFGMKAHIGVDAKSGLVHTIKTTTAKVHDARMTDDLIRTDDAVVFGDKGYVSDKRKRASRGEYLKLCVWRSAHAVKTGDVRLDFDRRVRLEFHGSKISSNGGLLLFRELDEVLGLHDIAGGLLRDTRTGHNRLHSLVGLLRQSVFGRLAGYDDVNDADRLSLDPVMRQVVGGRAVDAKAASSSQMGRFETEVLATSDNRTALADLSGQWIDRIHERKPPKWITLDMDSSVSPTHGTQEDTAWNGHFGCMCYHPLFVFNQFGHLERCALRPGNVHSADGWKDVLKSVMARYADRHLMRFFRGDAAFAIPDLYEMLEAESYFYAIRLRTNRVLQGKIAHLLKRPVGRPPNHVRRTYGDFQYQAASWDKPRRVIAKVEWHPGELFPRVGFVVTNMPMEADWIIQFYNQRGTAEQHIKEGKQAINWTRLSCKGMAQNEVRLQLHALAYNLGVFLHGTDLPEEIADWSLTSLQTRLIKTGARVVRHARAITFQLAEVAVSGNLFNRVLAAIQRLRAPPVPT